MELAAVRVRMASQACIRARLADSIMPALRVAFRPAGARALAPEGFTAGAVAVSFSYLPPTLLMEKNNDEE